MTELHFSHSDEIWQTFPRLNAIAFVVEGVRTMLPLSSRIETLQGMIEARISGATESEMPEIVAWREVFTKMGLKATQHRCASEALLRRYRKARTMPSFHPLVDYLNFVSMSRAIPIAAFDIERVVDRITVVHADGSEAYLSFQGETEAPSAGEIIFRDGEGHAHSRRWTFRQSARSVVGATTDRVLIVAEALHQTADTDLDGLEQEVTAGAADAGLKLVTSRRLRADDRTMNF